MARKNQIIITIIAVITVIIVAVSTMVILGQLDKKQTPANNTSNKETEEQIDEDPFKEVIDETKNNQAKSIEEEAASLMESDPAKAKEKYKEASSAYSDAGNLPKASEMDANAMTAELIVKQRSEQ